MIDGRLNFLNKYPADFISKGVVAVAIHLLADMICLVMIVLAVDTGSGISALNQVCSTDRHSS